MLHVLVILFLTLLLLSATSLVMNDVHKHLSRARDQQTFERTLDRLNDELQKMLHMISAKNSLTGLRTENISIYLFLSLLLILFLRLQLAALFLCMKLVLFQPRQSSKLYCVCSRSFPIINYMYTQISCLYTDFLQRTVTLQMASTCSSNQRTTRRSGRLSENGRNISARIDRR